MTTNVQFDAAASRHSTSKTSDGSVLSQILRAASTQGIDPTSELYNEALELAKDGHYGQARARLHVLLGLSPNDGDAHLLLAKVHVAGQQWRRAIASLDEASQCGATVPDSLRDAVVRNLQGELDAEEEEQARSMREDGELRKLRSETRRLRSENSHLAGVNRKHERDTALWQWIATATSVVAIVFIVGRMLVGSSETPVEQVAAVEEVAPAVAAAASTPELAAGLPETQVRDPGRQAEVAQALADAGVPEGLHVAVRGSRVSLGGTVPSHAVLKDAIATVEALDGVDDVVYDAVVNTARRDGGTYTVSPGDSLSVIAYRMYGNQGLADTILGANPQLGGKASLQIGQKLTIPPVRE